LRLEQDVQLQLAGQMHQLGMHELAEAVLARARRRAGGKSEALVALMQQYLRQGKADAAVQVAHQVLRKLAPQRVNPYARFDVDAHREAIQTLARSGKLKDLIARLEAQVAASPQSVPMWQTLADYYRADGRGEEARKAYDRVAALRPDDAKLRFQMA